MKKRTKALGQSTWRVVEERQLSQALLKFMQTQRDFKCLLNMLEPTRPVGRHPSPFSQTKRRQSIIGATAYWNDPANGQAKLLESLERRAQEIENQKFKSTGHCESETVQTGEQ